jgi:hypothetical protein
MNEQDLRDCFAMFKATTGASPKECYEFADEMLEAREPEPVLGLPEIKRRGRPRNVTRTN